MITQLVNDWCSKLACWLADYFAFPEFLRQKRRSGESFNKISVVVVSSSGVMVKKNTHFDFEAIQGGMIVGNMHEMC